MSQETQEMTVYGDGDIQVKRPPELVLEEAMQAAKALAKVLAGKKRKIIMNGEQYLEFEDWQTVGRFYGVTAKVKETAFIDYGDVHGFEAKAVAIRADGMEISAAEAMCLNDEENWRARSKYEYLYVWKNGSKTKEDPPKDQIVWVDNPFGKSGKKMPQKERVVVGEEPVPLFQLKSMAQTRACAKALRNVLAWVVVLAGYKATPAEELNGQTHEEPQRPPFREPQKKTSSADQPEPSQVKDPDSPSTEAQHKAIFSLLDKLGIKDDLKRHEKATALADIDGETITSMKALSKGQASEVIRALSLELDAK